VRPLLLDLLGRILRRLLSDPAKQPDVLPDALIDATELCIYGVEVSRRRAEPAPTPEHG
jgi:hypothetical protein